MIEDYDRYDDEVAQPDNTIKGYRILIIVLIVLLGALGFQYYRQTNLLRGSEAELTVERDTLQNRLSSLIVDFDAIKFDNDTLNQNMLVEREKADSLFKRLKSERNWSHAKIKSYERELGTLRVIMGKYVHQIDSLNTLNNQLSKENVNYRKELNTSRLRTEMAEEKQQELQSKIREGAVIQARDISLKALSSRDKEVSRASRAERLRVDFILNANTFAALGERNIYARILTSSGAVLTDAGSTLFEFNGQKIQSTGTRLVDYQGEDLPASIYYKGDVEGGTYNVEIYMDGYMIGTNEIILK